VVSLVTFSFLSIFFYKTNVWSVIFNFPCSSQQKLPEQLVAFQLRQNTATRTPAVSQENHSNILLGVGSSCVTVRSPGSVQSLPTIKLQDYMTPSPVTKECPAKVSSLSISAKSIYSSPVASLKAASSSASDKSILPSPIEKVGNAPPPCSRVRSALSPLGVYSGVVLHASPCVSMKSTSLGNVEIISALLQQNDGAAAASNVSTTNLLMPTSLVREVIDLPAEHLQHGGSESPVAKKPMNRLIDAVSIKIFLTPVIVHAILQTILQNSVVLYLSSGVLFITSRA
jgi:hypothetical protein